MAVVQSPRTLIVIPTFNERENIGALADRLLALYPQVDVFVVDDSSADGTADAVREAQARHSGRLQLLVRSGKNGRGSAVLEGLRHGLQGPYELFFEMDADFSHRPEEVALFFPQMQRYDMVVGSRYVEGSEIREWGRKRTVFSALANAFARFILRIPLHDYTNGFRCYTRRAVEAIDMDRIDAKGYVVLSEVAYQLHRKGLRIGEVPTLFINRRRGISNLGFHEINEALFSVLRIRWPRLSAAAARAGTFLLRGSFGAVLDVAILLLLVRAGLFIPFAFLASGCLAIVGMFFLRQRRWGPHANLPVGMFLFLYVPIVFITAVIAAVLWIAGAQYLLAKILAIALVSPLSYVCSTGLRQE